VKIIGDEKGNGRLAVVGGVVPIILKNVLMFFGFFCDS
jgi:hypothetical protein